MGEIIIGDIVCSVEWLLNTSFELVEYPITERYIVRVL